VKWECGLWESGVAGTSFWLNRALVFKYDSHHHSSLRRQYSDIFNNSARCDLYVDINCTSASTVCSLLFTVS
jgi:hypothetical protein